jgi:peptide/nickel transport system substrate-binding protein
LAENPFYRGPRPHHVDRIEVDVKTNPLQSVLQIEKGERDYDVTGVPGATAARLARKYGVNRVGGQFHVNTTNSVNYVAFNTKKAPFTRANVRKAVNFAIDRTAINRQAGAYAGKPTDQVLPPNLPGYLAAKIYPLEGPDLATARRLAGDLKANVSLYYSIDPAIERQALVIQQNLKAIGLTVEPKGLPFDVLIDQLTDKPEYDMIMLGWLQDYPDPFDFMNVLLSGKSITPRFNNNIALFDDPAFNRRLEAASRLKGEKRYRTYGQIDIDMMRQAAPWAPLNNSTQRELVSKRVGCYAAPGAYGWMSIAAVCLK